MTNLGTVPFLNTRPLIYPLEKSVVKHGFNIMYFEPSLLSQKLAEGTVDVALIPSVELFRSDDYDVLPGISISSFGKVDSVILSSEKEISRVKSVSVDSRSRSSAALLRIIFEVFLGKVPKYVNRKPGNGFLNGVDAGMLIGNSGLRSLHLGGRKHAFTYDLGDIWTKETGLPFVYAVLAMKKSCSLEDGCYESLLEARCQGENLVEEIAGIESKKLGLRRDQCSEYLSERIKYDLDDIKIEGLMKYRDLLYGLNEIETRNVISFREDL